MGAFWNHFSMLLEIQIIGRDTLKKMNHVLIALVSSLVFAAAAFAVVSGFTEVSGTTVNYNGKDKDGIVDFSLVIPAMTAEELMNFDLGRIISPENDTLSILGKSLEIPSNLSLPKQVESYFLSFTLDKPAYRSYVREMGYYNLYALQGNFPIKKVVDGFQGGKSLFELVNLFTFKGGGSEVVEVKGPTKDVKIGINTWTFAGSNTVTAPAIAANKEVLSFSMFQLNGELYPTDIKRILSGKTEKLINRADADNYVLAVLVNNTKQPFIEAVDTARGNIASAIFGERAATFDLNQISYNLQKVNGAQPVAATFLPQVPAPKYASNTLTATAPQTIAGVSPYAMMVVLSEVTTAGSANLPLDFKNVLWSAPQATWQTSIAVPADVSAMMVKGKKYSFDVLFLGTAAPVSGTDIDWSQVTHVTRNSVTIAP